MSVALEALAAIAIVLTLTLPGWHEELDDQGSERDVRPFPSRQFISIISGGTVVASGLGLVSMLWQHIAAVASTSAVERMAYGTVETHVGFATMALGWVGLLCIFIATFHWVWVRHYVEALDRLTD